MADLLIDTDIFIDHLRGTRRLQLPPRKTAMFSVITRCELLSGRGAEEESIQRLLAPLRELAIDRATAERAGRLRRHVELRTPDALIAATALEHKLTLLTKNARHFNAVSGLRVVGPGT
jgi:predicted nucleic acid-binding protein